MASLVVFAGLSVAEAKALTIREVNAIVDKIKKRGL